MPISSSESASGETEGTSQSVLTIDEVSMTSLLGANDSLVGVVEERYRDVSILVRGNQVTLNGRDARIRVVERVLRELVALAATGREIGAHEVRSVIDLVERDDERTSPEVLGEVILTVRGSSIRPKTLGQSEYVAAINTNTIVFGIGPAGTGKTYLAMAKAVQALQRKQIERIILTRPAVEAGERLGYLPGTLTEKIDPYLRPLYDALNDMMDSETATKLLAVGAIEVAPLAYMRGRTLNNAFIILDEAQNTTPEQMKMFLTRLGFNSTMVVTGDITQVDLPHAASGLRMVTRVLADMDDIHFARLTSADVVRHSLVGRIVDAYAEYDARAQARAYEREQAAEFANRAERRGGTPHDHFQNRRQGPRA